jgi:hypothetical protein
MSGPPGAMQTEGQLICPPERPLGELGGCDVDIEPERTKEETEKTVHQGAADATRKSLAPEKTAVFAGLRRLGVQGGRARSDRAPRNGAGRPSGLRYSRGGWNSRF